MRKTSLLYLTSLAIYGSLTWMLSTIAVIDIHNQGQPLVGPDYYYLTAANRSQATLPPLNKGVRASTANIRLGPGIPQDANACQTSLLSANCTYDLAISALSSQLITLTPYTLGTTSFSPPYGTRGISYDVLAQAGLPISTATSFQNILELNVDYCVPVLDQQTVFCNHDTANSRVAYKAQDVIDAARVYTVTINPETYPSTHVRIDSQNGTMTVAQSLDPSEPENTIITASGKYADILSQLTYGMNATSTSEIFTVVCTIQTSSSWLWVTSSETELFTSLFPSNIYCGSGVPEGYGFTDLYDAIESAVRLSSGTDGYSKYFNLGLLQGNVLSNNQPLSEGDEQFVDYLFNMTMLESLLSQLYEIIQTTYTASVRDGATATTVHILVHEYLYEIYVAWNALTILALSAACLLWCCTLAQTVLWVQARLVEQNQRLGDLDPMWNLLHPSDLMQYSALAAAELNCYFKAKNSAAAEDVRDDFLHLGSFGAILTESVKPGGSSEATTVEPNKTQPLLAPERCDCT